MAYLANPTRTIAVLETHGFHFQKKYGQNFLIDANIIRQIIGAAEITQDDVVLEIGPGIGTMTQFLCETAREVVAVEIDANLLPILADTLSAYDHVTVLNEDILKTDISSIAEQKNHGKPIKVVANLPYYITTPIIMELLESQQMVSSVTVMVQKEVADRMQASPGTKDYGALSLAVRYFAEPEVIATVSPHCFIPQPKVESTVIRLTRHEKCPVVTSDEKFLFQVIRASFQQRRKTLANGLGNAPAIALSKEEIREVLRDLGYAETVRGETLSLEEFAAISEALLQKMGQ